MLSKSIKSDDFNRTLIERVYIKNAGMQTLIDVSMIDMCKEEGVSPEQLCFCFSLLLPEDLLKTLDFINNLF